MRFLRNLPIKSKLLLVTLAACGAALALSCASLFWFQSIQFRKGFAEELASLAAITAYNSSATLAFDDKKSGNEVLNSLKVKPQITSASILDGNGKLFANYGEMEATNAGALPQASHVVRFVNGSATLTVPIYVQDAKPGSLRLQARYQEKYRELAWLYTAVLIAVVLISLLIVLLFSSLLQRLISDPLIQLANVAGTITEKEDYTARAPAAGRDEVGALTVAFNRMLDQIETRDAALNFSQRKLETLIHSIDGIVWECNANTIEFTFVSRQSERILGYTPEEWMGNPNSWQEKLHPEDAAKAVQMCQEAITRRQPYEYDYRMVAKDGRTVWIRESGVVLVENDQPVVVRGIFQDITARKTAEAELEELHEELVTTSRQAGMAEVATGVLHNVGNVLNSVGVSATLVGNQLRQSKVAGLRRATTLLREKNGRLAEFLTTDPKGKLLPEYLGVVADQLVAEHAQMAGEMESVAQHVDHIKEIVAMQQSYAKVSGAFENLAAADLVEDALKMNLAAFDRHGVEVVREIDEIVPLVCVDRHRVLQILINVIRNAKYAMDDARTTEKRLVVRVAAGGPGRVRIAVRDNGVGISADNLVKIFNHGFTTKRDGHGFGLHSGANAAKEMGGSLTAQSEGLGKGACFTLELPVGKIAQKTNSAAGEKA